jgi:general stress protein YciG
MADSNFNPAQNLSDEARSKGGQNSPTNFKNRSKEEVRRIASEGGKASGGNSSNNSGNNGSSS